MNYTTAESSFGLTYALMKHEEHGWLIDAKSVLDYFCSNNKHKKISLDNTAYFIKLQGYVFFRFTAIDFLILLADQFQPQIKIFKEDIIATILTLQTRTKLASKQKKASKLQATDKQTSIPKLLTYESTSIDILDVMGKYESAESISESTIIQKLVDRGYHSTILHICLPSILQTMVVKGQLISHTQDYEFIQEKKIFLTQATIARNSQTLGYASYKPKTIQSTKKARIKTYTLSTKLSTK